MELSKAKEILNSYDFDEIAEFANGEMQQAIDTVLKELDRQKQVKAEMRKVAWEEGYNQGYLAGAMESI